MCDLNGLEAVTGRGRAQPEFLTLYFHCEDDDVEQPSVVVRNDAGAIVLG